MTQLDDFWQRIKTRHAEEVEAGAHDAECEWRAAGHYLCNCAARKRIANGVTTAPRLSYNYPTCEGCWQEVEHDGDCFFCPRCHVHWTSDNEERPGEFTDDHGPLDTSRWDNAEAANG